MSHSVYMLLTAIFNINGIEQQYRVAMSKLGLQLLECKSLNLNH